MGAFSGATTAWPLPCFISGKRRPEKQTNEGKIDLIVDAALKSGAGFPVIPYAQALAEMGPVKVADNRPV